MAAFRFHLSVFQFATLIAFPISCFAVQTLTDNPNFDPEVAVLGDAKFVDDNSHVQLTGLWLSSSGLLIHNKPFKLFDPSRSKPKSFSTDFTFSMSPGEGDGLAFVVLPYNSAFRFVGRGSFGISSEKKYLGIEFDTKMDGNVGDVNANHVGVDVNSLVSVSVCNVSSIGLVLNNGETLKSWIDYDSSSKRIEVRLSKFGDRRPYDPFLAYHIDLLQMWGNEDVFVGIVSSNGISEQTSSSSVYSWNFRLRNVPYGLHSLPANPRDHGKVHGESFGDHKRSICPLRILAGLIFAIGCGALLAFVVLFVWAIVVNKHTEFPTEYHAHPDDFKYEKINIVVDEDGKGGQD
ncbi:hypothetical protein JRO89_XS14G0077900 [Xanthoceras sorbifolium]|uniref:Legume lectin domain-containing protein n=1 Tax=Xanthoceras sorbifolium TaxID=99658 RepID=A0ABQ8H4F5_9ROSI|nr:hypothetical protein JRO89_XS14G0077900 [Xanthoceras sorbifolium]